MADNVTLPGTGAVVASDEVTDASLGTVQVQYTKLMDGTLNSTNKAVVNSNGELLVREADAFISGNISAAQGLVSLSSLTGMSCLTTVITGVWSASCVIEGSMDGTAWVTLSFVNLTTGATSTGTTANGVYQSNIAGFSRVRVRAASYSNGTVAIAMAATAGSNAVNLSTPLPTGSNTIGTVYALSNGPIAAGSAIGGTSSFFPVLNGGRAIAGSTNVSVLDGTIQHLMLDKMGRQVVALGHVREQTRTAATTITASTSATTITATATAGMYYDITHIDVTNGSATPITVGLSDGMTTYTYNLPAGGGFVIDFTVPLKASLAGTPWTLTCSQAVSSVYCNVVYVVTY